MQKYSFLDDYSEGCHPNILHALSQSNMTQHIAYGNDEYSVKAKEIIRNKIENPTAGIYFVSGGTQANLIVISSILKSYEAVVSAEIGHILVREAGAIEATGHKVIPIKTANGKLSPADIQNTLDSHSAVPHMVKPKLVYISNATEIGTIYLKHELEALHDFCKSNNMYLFLDGARLGSALCCEKNDLTLKDLSQLTDVFYIGGTKNGALIGEAIVVNNASLNSDFEFNIKQRGAMLSKSRLLGIQFLELFKSNLFYELATQANKVAQKLSIGLEQKGYDLSAETQTNQIFVVLPNVLIEKLQENFDFYVWEKRDFDHSVVRLVTSWATDETRVNAFLESI